MTKKRRFALTEEDAETATFAIRYALRGIDATVEINDAYTAWRTAKLENLLNKLSNYKWEV